jgi:hypothetical protein
MDRLFWRLTEVLRSHAAAINGQDVWDDLPPSSLSVRAPAGVAPSWDDTYQTWDFAAAATNTMEFNFQMPHAWREGSELAFHVHCFLVTAPGANNVSRWKLEYVYYDANGEVIPDLSSAGNWSSETISWTHPATALESDVITFAQITPTGKSASMVLKCKLSRLGADGADTAAQVVKIDFVDVHYKRNTDGSRLENSK